MAVAIGANEAGVVVREMSEAIVAVRASLAAGRLEMAQRQLDFAEERFGDRGLREARAELEEARRVTSGDSGIS